MNKFQNIEDYLKYRQINDINNSNSQHLLSEDNKQIAILTIINQKLNETITPVKKIHKNRNISPRNPNRDKQLDKSEDSGKYNILTKQSSYPKGRIIIQKKTLTQNNSKTFDNRIIQDRAYNWRKKNKINKTPIKYLNTKNETYDMNNDDLNINKELFNSSLSMSYVSFFLFKY